MNTSCACSVKSLKLFYGEKRLKILSASWIDDYLPWLSDEKLCSLFEDTFLENPSLFEINGNAKQVINELMKSYYHNEIYVKSSFVRRIKNNNSVSFFELPVFNSRIDLCSINNHSVAYEIKTKYDNLNRLNKQLNDYLKAFEYVYVICSNDKTGDILNMVPECVGVYDYDDSKKTICFNLVKKAELSNVIDPNIQISVLRKEELNSKKSNMNNQQINSLFKKTLKNRYKNKWRLLCKNCKSISDLDYQYYFKTS